MSTRQLLIASAALTLLAACSKTPARIDVEPQTIRFRSTGEQIAVLVRVLDLDGESIPDSKVTFTSSAPEVATVSPEGMVTAAGPGEAQIRVSSGELSVSVAVRVSVPRKVILRGSCGTRCTRLSETPLKFRLEGIDAVANLQATVLDELDEPMETEVRFEAADPEFAAGARKPLLEVSRSGEVRSIGVGRYLVVASAGGAAEQALFEVVMPRVDVVKAQSSLWVKPGSSVELKPTTFQRRAGGKLVKIAGAKLSYNSSDPSVVTVDENGRLQAVGVGRAEVIAAAESGAFAHVEVTVSEKDRPKTKRKRATKKRR